MERAGARPEFELGPHNLAAVSEICAGVQGMPLAILLAAAWVEVLSPPEILAEIRISLDFLQAEWADLPPRQRSVRLTFDYSWNLLEDADRAVFRGLCIFRGAYTRQAAEMVGGAGAIELRRLADKSLLMPQAGEWYAVHELLRQYGLEKLKENPVESARVHRCYSAYYLEKLAEWEAGLKGARQVETLALMDAKINDLRLAWDLACEGFDLVHVSCALESLCLYYQQRIRLKEGESACRFALEKLEAFQHPPALHVQARLLAWQSRFYRLVGEHELSHQSLENAGRCLVSWQALVWI